MGDRLERPEWLEDAAPVRRVVHGPADERYAAPVEPQTYQWKRYLPDGMVELPLSPAWQVVIRHAEGSIAEALSATLWGDLPEPQRWTAEVAARPHREAAWTVRNEPLDRDR